MKNQIFVYDQEMSLSYLLKRTYSKNFLIDSYSTKRKVLPRDFNYYEAAFFMITSLEDFHFFMTHSANFKRLFVITSVKLFEMQISSMMLKNIVIFDFHDDLKKNILRELDFQLKLKKLI